MKNNQLTGILLGLVFLSTLAGAGLICKYNYSIHKIQNLPQQQLAAADTAQKLMQGLLNDSIEYANSTRNPDMIRIVQGVTGKPAK